VQLDLPSFVINRIDSVLSGRGQQCRVNGVLTKLIHISLSIVQVSAIGHTLCLVIRKMICVLCQSKMIFLNMLMTLPWAVQNHLHD